jgi:hypothetical protein
MDGTLRASESVWSAPIADGLIPSIFGVTAATNRSHGVCIAFTELELLITVIGIYAGDASTLRGGIVSISA